MAIHQNETRRPVAGNLGAARDRDSDIGLRKTDCPVTTTPDGERIVDVDCWLNGNRLAWWCCHCRKWHGNGFNAEETDIVRHAPPCWHHMADDIRLVLRGDATSDLQARISRADPPAGTPHPGKLVDANGIYDLLLEQLRSIRQAIRAGVRSDRIIDQFGRAVLVTVHWFLLDEKGDSATDRIRDRDLFSAAETDMPKRRSVMGDLVARAEYKGYDPGPGEEAISSAGMRRLLLEGVETIENLIRTKQNLGLIAARFEAESHKVRIWRATARRGTGPICARKFHSALKRIVEDHMDLPEAVSAFGQAHSGAVGQPA
jgi:hypothetical protein